MKYKTTTLCEQLEYWTGRISLDESMSEQTTKRLKSAAKRFAKMAGDQIKAGFAVKICDGNNDALVAIKNTIKMNSSAANVKKILKAHPEFGFPATDEIATAMAKSFVVNVFEGRSVLVNEIAHQIDLLENAGIEAADDYIRVLTDMIHDENNAKLKNLKKSTEQFNYFANEVFSVWRRDPEISSKLNDIPDPTHLDADEDSEKTTTQAQDDEYYSHEADIDDQMMAADDMMSEEEFMKPVMKSKADDLDEKTCPNCGEEIDEAAPGSAKYEPNTVGAVIEILKKSDPFDELMIFDVSKKQYFLTDIGRQLRQSKGITTLEIAPGKNPTY